MVNIEFPQEEFADKIECGTEEDSCWVWTAANNGRGYGQFTLNDKKILAHRFSYMLYKGKIPEGYHIDHLCKYPPCVNPDYLEAVTQKENMNRIERIEKTHCPQGHEYSEENTYVNNNKKTCKTCRRKKDRIRRALWNN